MDDKKINDYISCKEISNNIIKNLNLNAKDKNSINSIIKGSINQMDQCKNLGSEILSSLTDENIELKKAIEISNQKIIINKKFLEKNKEQLLDKDLKELNSLSLAVAFVNQAEEIAWKKAIISKNENKTNSIDVFSLYNFFSIIFIIYFIIFLLKKNKKTT